MLRRSAGGLVVVLVAALSSPVATAQVQPLAFGPEVAVDQPVLRPMKGTEVPAIAVMHGGTLADQALVVWVDPRTPAEGLFAARLTDTGMVMDQAGFEITGNGVISGIGRQPPGIATDGNQYLVVWEQSSLVGEEVYGTRVSRDGVVLDPGGFPIAPLAGNHLTPAVAFDGTRFVVVWTDDRNAMGTTHTDVFGAHVTSQGMVVEPDGFAVAAGINSATAPAVVAAQGQTLVAFSNIVQTSAGASATRLSADGVPLDVPALSLTTSATASAVALATDGTQYFVAWNEVPQPAASVGINVQAARIGRAGPVVDQPALTVATDATASAFRPFAGWDGQRFVVLWRSNFDGTLARGARVSPTGSALDPTGVPLPNAAPPAAMAFGGSQGWAIESSQGHVTASTLTANGGLSAGSPFVVAFGSNSEALLATGSIAGQSTLLWNDDRSDPSVLVTAAVDAQGQPGATHVGPAISATSATSDGQNFFLVTQSAPGGPYQAAIMTPTGTLLSSGVAVPPTMIQISNPVFDGTSFLITTEESPSFRGYRYDTAGQLLDPVGEVLSFPGNPLNTAALFMCGNQVPPFVSCQDAVCLFTCAVFGTNATFVRASLLTGTTFSPQGVIAGVIDDSLPSFFAAPALASSPDGWLVVVTDLGTTPYQVRATRFSRQGAALDSPALILAQSSDPVLGAIAGFDGQAYVVSWAAGSSCFITRVMPDGTLPDSAPMEMGGVARAIGTSIAYMRGVGGAARLFVRARVPAGATDGGAGGADAATGAGDASTHDTGVPASDSGAMSVPDTGVPASDSGLRIDAGSADGGRASHHGGCNASGSGPEGSLVLLAMLVSMAGALRGRRRSQR
jgi:hypothetical protein